MDEPKKSLTQQAIDQLPKNELRAKVVTEDGGRSVTGKVSLQKTWGDKGWLAVFGQAQGGKGQRTNLSAGVEGAIKLGK